MAEKLFYSMGEVAEMFDVNASLIRHWESQFSVIRPKRNKKGNRLFSPQDVENLKLIYHLVKERGMTLEGAKKALKQKPATEGGVQRDAELMERLQRIRAPLVEVREDLKAGQGELLADGDAEVPAAEAGAAVPRRKAKPVVKIVPEDAAAQGCRTRAARVEASAQAPPQEGGAGTQGALRLLRTVALLGAQRAPHPLGKAAQQGGTRSAAAAGRMAPPGWKNDNQTNQDTMLIRK